MTTVTTTLIKKLNEGSVSFKFRKIDGTIREATGTLNNDLIPADKRTSVVVSEDAASVPYFDFDRNDWRQFRSEAVIA